MYLTSTIVAFAILSYSKRKEQNLNYLNLICDAAVWPILLLEKCLLFSFRKNIIVIQFEDIEERS